MIGFDVGDKVRIVALHLDEFGSVGEIAAIDDGQYFVKLDRLHAPFRGWYTAQEMAGVGAPVAR